MESKRKFKVKLVLIGLTVIVSSLVASLFATHLSFMANAEMNYRDAMVIATIVPLLVAPVAYTLCARLSMKLFDANAMLHHISRRDGLTGLLNRRAFMELVDTEQINAGSHLLVMADIDHFKRINDTMGHAAGDVALQHIARLLDREAPTGALVARLGGEEFALLIPAQGNLSELQSKVEALRIRLASLPVITSAGVAQITASFGVALSAERDTLDSLLSRADQALYAAKNGGRNRTVQAGG